MPDPDDRAEPRRPLREVIAADPAARGRVGRVYAELLAVVLLAVASLSALLVWHLARRGRLIRERLGPPRQVRWPEDADGRDPTESRP